VYLEKGNLVLVTYYEAGKTDATKTVKHTDSEHIRPPVSPQLLKPLLAGTPPDKPKDPTPQPPSNDDDFDPDF
jgi:hypothetical protein